MATLKDVAKEAGLTTSTVSRILNNRGYISDNARQKVDVAMKKLNYQQMRWRDHFTEKRRIRSG